MDSHNTTVAQLEHDVEITQRLMRAADLVLLAGAELNAAVELHLAHLDLSSDVPPQGASPSDEIAETPGPEPLPPGPGLGSIRRLELIAAIRAGLGRLWPGDPKRQAAWLRGYLRPRGHDSLNLGGCPDELLVRTSQAVADLVDLIRTPEGETFVENLRIDGEEVSA